MADTDLDIEIVGGLDQDTDSLLTTKPVGATNCRYQKAGTLQTRGGMQTIGPYNRRFGDTNTALPRCDFLTTYRDELVRIGGYELCSFQRVNSATDYIDKGPTPTFYIERTDVIGGEVSTDHDILCTDTLVAMVSSQVTVLAGVPYFNVVLDVFDATTKNALIRSRVLDTSSSVPKLALLGSNVLITWVEFALGANALIGILLNPTTLQLGAPVTLVANIATASSDATAFPSYDILVIGSNLYAVTEAASGTNRIKVTKFNTSLAVVTTLTVTSSTDTAINTFSLFGDSTILHAAWGYTSGAGPYTMAVKTTGITVSTFVTLYNAATVFTDTSAIQSTPRSLGGVPLSSTRAAVTFSVFTATQIDSTLNYFGKTTTFTLWQEITRTTGAVIYSPVPRVLPQFCVLSRPIYSTALSPLGDVYNGLFAYGTNIHSANGTGFIVSLPVLDGTGSTPTASLRSTTLTRQAYFASVVRTYSSLSNFVVDHLPVPQAYYLAAAFDNGLIGSTSVLEQRTGSGGAMLRCVFDRPTVQSCESGDLLLLGGGVPSGYDGQNVFELGFAYEPDVAVSLTAHGSSGHLSTGDYRYLFIYTWTDSAGNVHQSGPSPLSNADKVAVTANQAVTVVPRQLGLTNKCQGGAVLDAVQIDIYRTLAGGASYYYVSSLTNNTTYSSLTYEDTASDSSIESNAQPYTLGISGEELANRILPSCRFVTGFKGSVVFSGSDDGTTYFSKPQVPGYGPGFNGQLTVDPFTGSENISALKAQDDSLILWTPSRIFSVSGDPPLANGNSSVSLPVQIPSAVGCRWAQSLVTVPQGTVFISDGDSYWLLTRGYNSSPIGKDIEDTFPGDSANPVTNSVLMGNQAIVRVARYLAAAEVAVLDLRELDANGAPTWTFEELSDAELGTYTVPPTNPPTIDVSPPTAGIAGATLWQGYYTWVSVLGYTYQETVDVHVDRNFQNDCFPITVTGSLSWVKMKGIQNYNRCRKIGILFETGTDDDSQPPLTITLGMDYGQISTQTRAWTAAEVSAMTRKQVQMHPHPQKCESFQVSWNTAGATRATEEDTFKIVGVRCTVDINRGQVRIRPAQVK